MKSGPGKRRGRSRYIRSMDIVQDAIAGLSRVTGLNVVELKTTIDLETVRLLGAELHAQEGLPEHDEVIFTSMLEQRLKVGETQRVRGIKVTLDREQPGNVICVGHGYDPKEPERRIDFRVTGNWMPGDGSKPARIVTQVVKS